HWGLIFPGLIPGFGVFLMRQFFSTLPRELFDAARMDGVSEPALFVRMGIPLVGPGLAALGIFAFIGNWNAYLWPLVATQSASMRTVPVGISAFSGEAGAAWHLIMSASALGVVPVLIAFIIFQRQIIEGVVLSGVKG
ncbi:MAG TPA: carbohydrate ABC transporter permease, partial [Trueperaceae bacterium]|nr:carbohydrate ABC transporter permease [Trueperaceae bacterium]